MAESVQNKKRYIIYMTEEQKEITCGIFNFHGWDLEIHSDDDTCDKSDDKVMHKNGNDKKYEDSKVRQEHESGPVEQNISTEAQCQCLGGVEQEESLSGDTCPYYLSSPCVTANPQAWLGTGRSPQPGNNTIRKKSYRKYWTMLDRRGLWCNSIYLERKNRLMQESHVELTVREIMPCCVLEQVRKLYPNPKDVPYMGHFCLLGRRMTRFIYTQKAKGLCVISSSTFIYIVYVAFHFHPIQFQKPYILCGILACKDNATDVVQVRNGDKSGLDSNAGRIMVTKVGNVDYKDTVKFENLRIRIGILIPASTRNIKSPRLENLTLTTICLPSIYKSLQMGYSYVIYVGINPGDYLETVKHDLENKFDLVKVIVTPGKTFTKTVNDIARNAYREGMEYMVRINDDTSFVTKNWTSAGLNVLRRYKPPNVGVVGPTCHEGNQRIMTHDMVHRTHLEIFDFYYPPYFDNWWADDWITDVYKPNRSTKLKSWLVKHHLKQHGTRYRVDYKKGVRLRHTLTFDRERLTEYLSNLNSTKM